MVTTVLVALLGIVGLKMFSGKGPREHVKTESGSNVVMEELSFYRGGTKVFGKVVKPADENGSYPDSLGKRPVLLYFHEPLKTAYPESLIQELSADGVIGYVTAFHGNEKDIEFIVKKISKEKFADKDRMFIIADSTSSSAAVKAAGKLGEAVSGLILIKPSLDDKAKATLRKLGYEVLGLNTSNKDVVYDNASCYLEINGALK